MVLTFFWIEKYVSAKLPPSRPPMIRLSTGLTAMSRPAMNTIVTQEAINWSDTWMTPPANCWVSSRMFFLRSAGLLRSIIT